MINRALLLVAGLVGLALPAIAQESRQLSDGLNVPVPNVNPATDVETATSARKFPALTLSDNAPFFFPNTFAWVDPTVTPEFLPPMTVVYPPPRRVKSASPRERNLVDMLDDGRSTPVYVSGEVGFMYGKSFGKRGGDAMEGYILSEIATDKFQLTVGASYSESNFRFPRSYSR